MKISPGFEVVRVLRRRSIDRLKQPRGVSVVERFAVVARAGFGWKQIEPGAFQSPIQNADFLEADESSGSNLPRFLELVLIPASGKVKYTLN